MPKVISHSKVVMKEFYYQALDTRITLEQVFDVGGMPVAYVVTRASNDSQPLRREIRTVLTINCHKSENYSAANNTFREIVRGML